MISDACIVCMTGHPGAAESRRDLFKDVSCIVSDLALSVTVCQNYHVLMTGLPGTAESQRDLHKIPGMVSDLTV